MNTLYYVADGHCGTCTRVRREVIDPLIERHPGRVVIVDTLHYRGDLKRIDQRKAIDFIPMVAVEDENGREVARIAGRMSAEELESYMDA